jgi:hypothetical protein
MGSRGSRLAILALTVLWAVVGVASVVPAAFSVMMFDAPGATERPATVVLVLAVLSFPLVCLFTVVNALACRRSEQWSRAYWFLALPAVNLLAGGAAAWWIEAFQGGKFAG